MSLRMSKKYANDVYLQDPIGTDYEGNELTILDVRGGESQSIDEQVYKGIQIKKLYENMKMCLKDREKLVLELRYGIATGEEVTQREIGKLLGISRSYV